MRDSSPSTGPLSFRSRRGRGEISQQLLHDDHIHPFPVEQTLLTVDPDRGESHPLVESDSGSVEREGREHQLVVAELTGGFDQPAEKVPTNPLAAPLPLDIDGEIDDVIVGGPGIEGIETAPPGDAGLDLGHDDEMARPAGAE